MDTASDEEADIDEQAAAAIEHDDQFDDEESADDELAAKTIHRGIPTWEETIDLIVSRNIETRAKKGGGANRGWNGGRGGSKSRPDSNPQPSNRGRGGRGKSSKKRS